MEISRRCLGCGASVRVRASFCPQCGQRLEAESVSPPPSISSPSSKPTENFDALRTRTNIGPATHSSVDDEGLPVTAESNERAQRTVPYIPKDEMPLPTLPPPAQTFVPETNEERSSVVASSPPASSPTQTVAPVDVPIADKTGSSHSRSFAATEVVSTNYETEARRYNVVADSNYEKSSRPRGERMRDASAAFIEEASDDPGLRFVLIAIALFLLFLVFLFFSHIIG